jgi:electron transfer flavoprotein alpha subunit
MAEIIHVVVEQRAGKLNRVSLETLAAAQAIRARAGWQVEALVVGSSVNDVAQQVAGIRVDKVYVLESPLLAAYTPDAFCHALRQFIAERRPHLVLLPHTYQVRDFAPRLAAALGRPLVSDATGFKFESGRLIFVRQMFQGKFSADVALLGEPPYFASLQAGAFRADQALAAESPAAVEVVNVEIPDGVILTRPQEPFREARQAVDLTQAEVIVAAGRGVKEEKNLALVQKLAEALGGEVAASRPICDAGWLPMERQVGSSGQTVAPKLYLALGISGAIQHLVGMKGARTVIAINRDAEAPIFEVADYAVVGDLFDVVPALLEEINKAKAAA